MSGAGNNHWRRSGQQANRQNQEARSGTNTPTRDGGRQQAMAALSGNAWGGAKGKAAGGAERPGAQQAPLGQSDSHVPVKDFNAAEVKRYLKKRYLETIGDQPSAVYHKVEGDSVSKRSSGAWATRGSMPHLMPNGTSFFSELKKKLAVLEQNSS